MILSPSDEPQATSNVGNAYMFTGRRFDAETGNYYYRARYYSPSIGRFLQPDPVAMYMQYASVKRLSEYDIPGNYLSPIGVEAFMRYDPVGRFLAKDPILRLLQADQFGFPVELNLYTYCGNNPINLMDPYGLGPRWQKFTKWLKKWAKKIAGYLPFGIGTTILEIDLAEAQAQGLLNYRDKVQQENEADDFLEECISK